MKELEYVKLTLENYRYYYGKNELKFSTTPDKNVVVIKGDNGAGKSNLLNAMTWCLYNEEIHNKENIGLPVMNTQCIADLAENHRVGKVSVSLILKVNGERWEITRSLTGTAEKASNWTKEEPNYKYTLSDPTLYISYQENNDGKRAEGEEADKLINQLLPGDLKSFFFIDGEQLRTFFEKNSKSNMKDAIERLSQLDLIENASTSLTNYRTYLRKKLQKTTPEMGQIQEDIVAEEANLQKFKDYIKIQKAEIDKLEGEKKDIKEYLEKFNGTSVAKLSKEQTQIENARDQETKRYHDLLKNKNRYLSKAAPIIFLNKSIKKSYDLIGELISKGELPPKIRKSFIEELIENKVCICGHELGPKEIAKLEEYKEKVQLSEYTNITYEGRGAFQAQLELIHDFPEKIDEYNTELELINDDIQTYQRKIDQIQEELKGINSEELQKKITRQEEIIKSIGAIEVQVKAAEKSLYPIEIKLKELAKKESTEQTKSHEYAELSEKIKLVMRASEVLERVEDIVKGKIRSDLEEKTKKHFLNFLREDGLFRDVTIDDTYQVSVINNEGFNNLHNLSAGQYFVLGYAFVAALRTITGYQAPVIVDSPFGKLDTIHQNKITKGLPSLLDNAQLVFLVTSSEYTPTVKRNLTEYMNQISYYEIKKCSGITSARLENVS